MNRFPPDLQAALHSDAHERVLDSGERVFPQEAPAAAIFFVVRGRVKITRVTRDGFETVLCTRGPGEFFCPVSLLDGGPQLGTAEARADTALLWWDSATFMRLGQEHPTLASQVQTECLAEVRHLMHRLENVASRRVAARVATALLALASRLPAQTDAPLLLNLTHQELAGWVGASRESVSRALGRMARQGLLELGRGRVHVLDMAGLRRAAGEVA